MIEIPIPKDVRKYEAKLVGPFTTRQLFCFIGAAAISYIAYKAIGSTLGSESTLMVCGLLASPLLILGWYKPYGMPFEKFFQSAFISTVLAPRHRKYKTKNAYKGATLQFTPLSTKEYKKRLAKEKKEYQHDENYIAYK